MRILIVTPAKPHPRTGNRITAIRWGRILRNLGHRTRIVQQYDSQPCDLLLSLHAKKTAASMRKFRKEHPEKPLLLALTGTDVYGIIDSEAKESLALADRLILLQPLAKDLLSPEEQARARVIYQSVKAPSPKKNSDDGFMIAVVGHLREVKDPFRTALAARQLPPSSRIKVVHVGAALTRDMEERARREEEENPRYRWLGLQNRNETDSLIARSHFLCITSTMEGGANVIGEAIALGTSVLASHISGSLGLLGEDYPGTFPVGDTRALAHLLNRAETDTEFRSDLEARCQARRPLFAPSREQKSWEDLLAELF